MRQILLVLIILTGLFSGCSKQIRFSRNPVFTGWYADPEGTIYNNKYWVFPTYSAPYQDQVFMDAFSSKDLTNWKKHERIIDTASVKWAEKAIWAPSVIEKTKYYLFLVTIFSRIMRQAV
jgi:beta-xylosidase